MENNLPKHIERKLSKLEALESGGVDNWEWYSESLKDWFAENEIDEELDSAIEELNGVLSDAEVDFPAGIEAGPNITCDEEELKKVILMFAEKYLRIKQEK